MWAGASALTAAVVVAGAVAATSASAASRSSGAGAAGAVHASLNITKAPFDKPVADPSTPGNPVQTYRYTLTNSRGMSVDVLSYGAILQQINVPGENGNAKDVILGFASLTGPNGYIANASPPVTAGGGPYFGETIGRYGNRIAKGTFKLNGKTYTLPVNNGVNSLHGGLNGFGNHIWTQVGGLVHNGNEVGVTLQYVSPNGDESHPAGTLGCPSGCTGFPAQLTTDVTFTLDNNGNLGIHYQAHNDDPKLATVVNLTNHSYFNLAGEDSFPGSAYGQDISINANKYTPTDTTQIPLGYEASVKGTPFDFTSAHPMGAMIDDVSANFNSPGYNQLVISEGYDHNWVLNPQTARTTGPDGLNLAATAADPSSGRRMSVWTDQPGVQFYTSNFLTGTLTGISGHTYRQGAAYTFETQHFPDSPNQPQFPTTTLNPGATMNSTTVFAFSS
jgi:aldose 1-epimerase